MANSELNNAEISKSDFNRFIEEQPDVSRKQIYKRIYRSLTVLSILVFSSKSIAQSDTWVEKVVQNGQYGGGFSHGEYPSWGDRTHPGLDVGGGCGLEVIAPVSGDVIRVVDIDDPRFSSVGNAVVIQHTDGEDRIYTAYFHMKSRPLVKNGCVSEGQTIGYTGDTGFARGCHLHFEVRRFEGIDSLFHSGFKNIYLKGDQRDSSTFRSDWIDPLVWLRDLPVVEECQNAPLDPSETPRVLGAGSNEVKTINLSFDLTDETNTSVFVGDFDEPLKLVYFGYTSCPDICPMTINSVSQALRHMDDEISNIVVLFITVDPKRDTPSQLQTYTDYFHPSIVGLTGTYDQITEASAAFGATFDYYRTIDGQKQAINQSEYALMDATDTYTVDHSSQVYIVGQNGDLFDVLEYGASPSMIEAKLRAALESVY